MPNYKLKRTNKEIDDVLNSAAAWEEQGGSGVPGMTYEQGVSAGVKWAIGDTEDHPIEEDPEPDEEEDEEEEEEDEEEEEE